MNQNILDITKYILDLPALPSIVAKILEKIDDPRTSASDLAKLISTDQAITAKILKVANSSYYSFRKKISTVQLAVSLLGYDTVSNLVLSISFFRHFSDQNLNDNFNMTKFWEHGLVVALVSKLIAKEKNDTLASEIFTVGILHDLGKLIIRQYLNEQYQQIERYIEESNVDSSSAEEAIINVTHAEIGSALCEKWEMPKEIINGILYHHKPSIDNDFIHSSIIYLADNIVNLLGYSYPEQNIDQINIDENELSKLSFLKRTKINQKDDENCIDMDYYLDLAKKEIESASEFLALLHTN